MANPKVLFITDEWGRQGIDVTYVKSKRTIRISGWYDSMVGIGGAEFDITDFFKRLGIDKKELIKITDKME